MSDNPNPGDDDKFYPHDLKGLLQFCLENTKDEDAPSESTFEEMDSEKRKWLTEALAGMTTDVIKTMKDCCTALLKDDEYSSDDRVIALENLADLCEDINLAQDFHKIGGFFLLLKLLNDSDTEIRWRVGELIAALTQNNPYCQHAFLDMELLPVLLKVLDNDDSDEVKVKMLYALSCLCRNLPEAQEAFVKQDGFSFLMRAMQTDVEKLKIKAAFMLRDFVWTNAAYKDTLFDMGMVEQLVSLLSTEHDNFHEHLLGALVSLVTDHSKCIEECQRPELQLETALHLKIKELSEKEEYLEEVEYSRKLLELICNNMGNSADNLCR